MEATLVLIKPDAVRRGLTDDIIERFRSNGLTPVFQKAMQPPRELIERHYAFDDQWRDKVGLANIKICVENQMDALEKLGTLDPRVAGEVFDR